MQEIIKYQEIDEQLRKLNAELSQSANRKKALDLKQYLKDEQKKLKVLEDNAQKLNEDYMKAKKRFEEYVSKLEALEKNVSAADGDKLDELNNYVAAFANKSLALENDISNMASRVEMINKDVETIMNNGKKARASYQVYKKAYEAEEAKLAPAIKKLEEEKLKQQSKVDPKLMAKYLSKSEGKIFPIIVPEINGRCGRCRMEISASKLSELKSKKVIECENCGRIIYVE